MIEKIFFDLDGTLWDFESNSNVALRQIYLDFNLNSFIKSIDEFVNIYQNINEKLWEQYRKGEINVVELKQKRFFNTLLFFEKEDRSLADNIGKDYLNKLAQQKKLFPNTVELLNYLKPRYDLCILTNGFNEVQHKKLKQIELDKYFSDVFTSDKIGYPKPNPIFFEHVLNTLSINPDKAIMIGDDLYADVLGAIQIGIKGIYFNPKKKIHNENIDFEVSNLLDIKEIL